MLANQIDQREEQYEILEEKYGVYLIELETGVYQVEYGRYRQNIQIFFSWPAAQASFEQRWQEAEKANQK